SSVLESFRYDALGRRVTDGSAASIYYSAAWQVLEECDSSGSTLQTYAWSIAYIDAMIARDQGSTRLYAQQDANSNVTALVSAGGSVQERHAEDPYRSFHLYAPTWSARRSRRL